MCKMKWSKVNNNMVVDGMFSRENSRKRIITKDGSTENENGVWKNGIKNILWQKVFSIEKELNNVKSFVGLVCKMHPPYLHNIYLKALSKAINAKKLFCSKDGLPGIGSRCAKQI